MKIMIKTERKEKVKYIDKLDVVTEVFCDFCKKELKPITEDSSRVHFIHLSVMHYDCLNDYEDSIEHFDACSLECAYKLAKKWIEKNNPTDWNVNIESDERSIGEKDRERYNA